MIRSIINRTKRWIKPIPPAVPALPNKTIKDGRSTDMVERMKDFSRIPGMLTPDRGAILYALAFASQISGDVVEIGSWQGRSTCFLAQACRDSGNGIVRAIDHFKGTPGNEVHYRVQNEDLSDLESNFRRNVAGAGLSDFVKLYNMTSLQAVQRYVEDFADIRMLFIDGDHSYESVSEDIRRFAARLKPDGVIVFDDYHSDGPGVVQAVEEQILSNPKFGHFTQFQGILIARKLRTQSNQHKLEAA